MSTAMTIEKYYAAGNTPAANWTVKRFDNQKQKTTTYYINDSRGKFQMQLAEVQLRVPFGISALQPGAAEYARYNMAIDVPPESALHRWARDVDEWALQTAEANSEDMFGQKLSRAELEKLYYPMLSASKGDHNPLMRGKVGDGGRKNTSIEIVRRSDKTGADARFPGTVGELIDNRNFKALLQGGIEKFWTNATRSGTEFGITLDITKILAWPEQNAEGGDFAMPDGMTMPAADSMDTTTSSYETATAELDRATTNLEGALTGGYNADGSYATETALPPERLVV